MFLPIVVYGHPILRKISEDITPEYPELEKFIRDLFQTMDEADGVRLAAPQVRTKYPYIRCRCKCFRRNGS